LKPFVAMRPASFFASVAFVRGSSDQNFASFFAASRWADFALTTAPPLVKTA